MYDTCNVLSIFITTNVPRVENKKIKVARKKGGQSYSFSFKRKVLRWNVMKKPETISIILNGDHACPINATRILNGAPWYRLRMQHIISAFLRGTAPSASSQ
jgi:hypothetical protein